MSLIIRNAQCHYTEPELLGDKKVAINTCKVIPLIALSILFAPVAMPLFVIKNVYRGAGRIRKVHYNRIDPSTLLPKEVLKLTCQRGAENLYGQKALNYLKALRSVCKEWKSISDEMRVELIYSGNLNLNDLPEIKTKDEALVYIEAHKNQLKVLILDSFDWNDADIKTILLACPHLEGLTVNFTNELSTAIFDDIVQFKNLKHLALNNGKGPLDYTALNALSKLKALYFSNMGMKDADIKSILNSHPNLEGLTLKYEKITNEALKDIIQFQKLQLLEFSRCDNLNDYSSLDHFFDLQTLRINSDYGVSFIPPALTNLPSLINLEIKCFEIQGDFPNLAQLAKLEKLKMIIWKVSWDELPSLENLSNLNELHLVGNAFDQIPPLDSLYKLKKLYIGSNNKLKDIPLLPAMLKELEISECQCVSPPDVKHLLNLEQLRFESCPMDFPPDYFDSLTQLKKLEFCDPMSKYSLHTLPSLDALTNLQILRLKTNFNNSPSLLELKNLKGLEIESLPFLGAPKQLKLLVTANLDDVIKPQLNQLTSLSGLIYDGYSTIKKDMFDELVNLELVAIRNSWFTKLPNLDNHKKLKEIYLNNEDIQRRVLVNKFRIKVKDKMNLNSLFEELLD